jgi:predicted NACHT family NTPase
MSRNIRGDESALKNVLSLVEALLQLSEEQDCELKPPLCVVWEVDKLRITGYETKKTTGNRSKTTEVGTTKEYLLNQIKDAGKNLKLPPQKAESSVSHKDRELQELQTALDWLKELKVREDEPARKNQGYWKFTLTLKHQTATRQDNLEVVEQKWKEHAKTNLKETLQTQTADKSIDWQEICRNMLEKHKRLTTNQFFFADDDMKFELEDIHVPLALVERTKPKKCSEDILAEQGSRLYEPSYEEKQRFEHEAFLGQIIRDGVVKTQGQRIALIGEPGAGKTTQLQTIAFWILNNNLGLPIWISLADLQGKSVENYLLQDWLKNGLEVVRVKEEQENAFADLFKDNSVWLLLDAADEMSSLQPLTEISQQLTGWVKNARVVLTCRVNVWEANAGALENFETYRLLNFEYPQQVQEFIEKWFQPRNLTPQPPLLIKERGSNKGEQLWRELNQAERRQRIQDLVKNPLRLALLCSTWQGSDKGLPETKAELYQQFVEEFYKWKENRFPTNEEKQDELNAALGRLAKRAIDQETSRFRLRHKLVREELGDAKQPNSLFWLALKLGWLNEVGLAAESATKEKVYAFYHPTFEEYFAALAVDDWHEFLNHVPDNPAQGVYRIFAPQWKEVILLWLGREDVGKKEKEEFIQALVEFDDGCGEFYKYKAYFLAAAGIAEFKNCRLADKIVEVLVKRSFGYFNIEIQKWQKFFDFIAQEAKSVLVETDSTKAVDVLTKQFPPDEMESWEATLILGKISDGNSTTINALIELLTSQYLLTRYEAAYSLVRVGAANQDIINSLTNLLRATQDKEIRLFVAWTLGKVDLRNQDAVNALTDLLHSSEDNETSLRVAEKLGEIAPGNTDAIRALVKFNSLQTDWKIYEQAEKSLRNIGASNPTAIAALNDMSPIIKHRNEQVTDAMLEYLGTSRSGLDRTEIAINQLDDINVLIELLCTGHGKLFELNISGMINGRLMKIASDQPTTLKTLIKLLYDSQYDKIYSSIVGILGKVALAELDAVNALIYLLQNSKDTSILDAVTQSLKRILQGNLFKTVLSGLKNYLTDQVQENDFLHYKYCYEIIWHCAQNMPYPAFYQAWHEQEKVKDGE